MRRKIIRIDEEKCDGCGVCVPACVEGALQIINGKAKLISQTYCDGLGACIGECPQGAITVEKREAEKFDKEAVERNLKGNQSNSAIQHAHPTHQSCPSAQVIHLQRDPKKEETVNLSGKTKSMLSQWPVKLTLIPPNAPFFDNADLLIAADCVPFAYPDFHDSLLRGRTLVVGCPKFDNAEFYKEKLTEIFKLSNIRNITVVNMEVPCCFGLYHLVKEALDSSGKTIPLNQTVISVKGKKHPSKTSHQPSLVKLGD